MFGLSKKEKRTKLSSKIVDPLRMLLLHVIEDGEIPSNIKFSLYVVGCFSKICGGYYCRVAKGKVDEAELITFTFETVSIVLQVDEDKIQALQFLGFNKKEPTFVEGLEDGGQYIDAFPDLPREPIIKIRKRIESIANSYGFE